LRICQVAAEVTPFAKTGGLGDVVAGLSRHLKRAGHDVRIFLPLYAAIARRYEPHLVLVDFLRDVPLTMGSRHFTFSVYTCKLPDSDVDV
jgi:starch synthase